MSLVFLMVAGMVQGQEVISSRNIEAPPPTKQYDEPRAATLLAKASEFIRVREARTRYKVSGDGMTAAVLDTGLRVTHTDFTGRVPAKVNFTEENNASSDDVTDLDGHGTHVAGILVASGIHIGMAPKANVIPLKVIEKTGGSWDNIDKALQWILENHEQQNISVINLSLGDASNSTNESDFENDPIKARVRAKLRSLRERRIAVVAAAGNAYFANASRQGMSFPAICREVISVGAVYDGDWGAQAYLDGAEAMRTQADQLTPFSQRLLKTDLGFRTTVFAPGAPIVSSGIKGDRGESLSGTSQASPVVAGVILLMQQYYRRESPHRQLPSVDDLEAWIRASSVSIPDPPKMKDLQGNLSEYDNVKHTNGQFLRLDALDALATVSRVVDSERRFEEYKDVDDDFELLRLRTIVRELQKQE